MSLALALCICSAAEANPSSSCEREILRAAPRHGVPLAVLYAVGLTETGRAGTLSAYALNVEGTPYFASDLADALAAFEAARERGAKLIDIGCMQINHFYHASAFAEVADMFDPARNVDYAARFLLSLYRREGTWTMAAARYHAGPNNDAAQKKYVCRVIGNMVASGFGAWTPEAVGLCQP
jgi:soluble lytic murein transglycosylase-like protein